jgi:hypothetical protein
MNDKEIKCHVVLSKNTLNTASDQLILTTQLDRYSGRGNSCKTFKKAKKISQISTGPKFLRKNMKYTSF